MKIALPIAVLVAASLQGQEKNPPAPPMPKPAPELAQLQFLVGEWTCTGKAPAGPFGPEHPTKGSVSVKRELDNFWYDIHFVDETTPMSGRAFWGYDTTSRKFVGPGVDNTGGWFTQTSDGMKGDSMVWEGEGVMMGLKVVARDTFMKKGDAELRHIADVELGGQWSKVVDETCKKTAAVPARK
jgi:hypothetical protein